MTEHDPSPDADLVLTGLMTLSEAARYLAQPVEEVFRHVMTGRLPAVWIGRRPYIDRATVRR
jgi:excisionase family DNA binding protein